jgi:spore coat polysaccharide biosynthesis protein SpsF
MTVRGFVQARMSSTRFPGKVLAPFKGRPIISHVLTAVQRALPELEAVVLTSDQASDDPLAAYVERQGFRCFRGAREDVLGRFHGCLTALSSDWILRICADSPLLNFHILRKVAERRSDPGLPGAPDLVTTIAPRTFPKGQNAELINAVSLDRLASTTQDPADREHVTRHFMLNSERYRIVNVASGRPELAEVSFAVDNLEDLRRLESMDEEVLAKYQTTPFWEHGLEPLR